MPFELIPTTAAGRRFVAAAEDQVETLRERVCEHDPAGSLPPESYTDLGKVGLLGAFAPDALGGFGLESVHDWACGLAVLARVMPPPRPPTA